MAFKFRKILLSTTLLLVLTACGESGSSGDTTAPVITLKGESPMIIVVGEKYSESGATATDDYDELVSVSIDKNNLNTDKIGQYKVKYTAMDNSRNTITVERTVNVIKEKDKTKPVITLNGSLEITIVKNENYIASNVEAEDNIDGILPVTLEGEVDTSTVGDYTLTYSAKDSSNNKATKTRTVHVVLSAVGQLLEDAAKGTNANVHYVVVGDSTRNLPYFGDSNAEVNTILVDSYYENQLDRINVDFSHTAYSGIEAYRWKQNIFSYPNGSTKFILQDTLNKIPSSNHSNYIVEFSLGINDTKNYDDKDELKIVIKDSIKILRENRSNVKVLMVSPVTYTFNVLTSEIMEEIYKEVYADLISEGATYLAFVSGREATKYVYDNHHHRFYGDNIHPNENGSLRLVNYIFSEVGGSALHDKMTISPVNDSPNHMSDAEMHVGLDDIRLIRR